MIHGRRCEWHPWQSENDCDECASEARTWFVVGCFVVVVLAFMFLVLACDPIPPPTPPKPEGGCAESCARLERHDCKAAVPVCPLEAFTDAGECADGGTIPCAEDCRRNPTKHPNPQCVVDLVVVDVDFCAAVEKLCF